MRVFGDWVLPQEGLKDFLRPQAQVRFKAQYAEQMQYRGFKRALVSTLRNMPIYGGHESVYERDGRQDRSVLLIWGRQDTTIPFEISDSVRRLFPRIEFDSIENTGHFPQVEAPERVNVRLISFLSQRAATEIPSPPVLASSVALH